MRRRVAADIAWRQVAGETFIIDLKRRMMYGLNRPGGAVWQVITEGGGEQSLLGAVADAAGREGASGAQPALDHFLATLTELGLLEGGDADAGRGVGDPSPPDPGLTPPLVTWSEELRAFALSCLLQSGQCSDPGPAQEGGG